MRIPFPVTVISVDIENCYCRQFYICTGEKEHAHCVCLAEEGSRQASPTCTHRFLRHAVSTKRSRRFAVAYISVSCPATLFPPTDGYSMHGSDDLKAVWVSCYSFGEEWSNSPRISPAQYLLIQTKSWRLSSPY